METISKELASKLTTCAFFPIDFFDRSSVGEFIYFFHQSFYLTYGGDKVEYTRFDIKCSCGKYPERNYAGVGTLAIYRAKNDVFCLCCAKCLPDDAVKYSTKKGQLSLF